MMISPKANVMEQLEFELIHYYDVVQHFSHCTTRTPTKLMGGSLKCNFQGRLFFSFIIFTTPSARAGWDIMSIFKRGLNSEFSFSQTSCLTKAEEISLPIYP